MFIINDNNFIADDNNFMLTLHICIKVRTRIYKLYLSTNFLSKPNIAQLNITVRSKLNMSYRIFTNCRCSHK